MVRGVQKQVVVIRDTGSDMFEQAILIVNPKSKKCPESDMASEAKNIVERYINRYYTQQPEKSKDIQKKTSAKSKRRAEFSFFGACLLIIGIIGALYMLLFKIIMI